MNLFAVEFEAYVEDGKILIQEQYQKNFGNARHIKVILLKPLEETSDVSDVSNDILQELMNNPLEIDNFVPLTRDELY